MSWPWTVFDVGAVIDAMGEIDIRRQDRLIGISQEWKLTVTIKATEQACRPNLATQRSSLDDVGRQQRACRAKGNAIVITKQASGTAKIDPLMAALNAVAWMSANPASSQPSIFVI